METAEVDCPLCGSTFLRDSPWKKICLKCYLKQKKDDGTYRERVKPEDAKEYVTVGTQIDPMMIKRLIQLCHPDRHSNSEAANIATRFLLELKARI